MGRPLRATHADRLAHVMFHTLDEHCLTPKDLRALKRRLERLVLKHHFKILYWTFMDNHIHLLFEFTQDKDCGIIVGTIENCLTKVYNHPRKRKGSLWRGRYKDKTIDTDSYLWNVLVYLGLNKIKAGGIRKLEEDYYSSYRAYSQGIEDGITTLGYEYYELGEDLLQAQEAFRLMLREAYLSWRDQRTWERLEKGEEVIICDGKVDMGTVFAMYERQEKILEKAHVKPRMARFQRALSKRMIEAKTKALQRIEKKKEKLAESLASRGIPAWVIDAFWADEGYISEFVWRHPDRFGMARAPT